MPSNLLKKRNNGKLKICRKFIFLILILSFLIVSSIRTESNEVVSKVDQKDSPATLPFEDPYLSGTGTSYTTKLNRIDTATIEAGTVMYGTSDDLNIRDGLNHVLKVNSIKIGFKNKVSLNLIPKNTQDPLVKTQRMYLGLWVGGNIPTLTCQVFYSDGTNSECGLSATGPSTEWVDYITIDSNKYVSAVSLIFDTYLAFSVYFNWIEFEQVITNRIPEVVGASYFQTPEFNPNLSLNIQLTASDLDYINGGPSEYRTYCHTHLYLYVNDICRDHIMYTADFAWLYNGQSTPSQYLAFSFPVNWAAGDSIYVQIIVYDGRDLNGIYLETINIRKEPSSPLIKTVNQIENKIRVTWDPPTSTGGSPITEYIVFRSISGGTFSAVSSQTSLFYDDTDILPNVRYDYKIQAKNQIGGSELSAALTVTTCNWGGFTLSFEGSDHWVSYGTIYTMEDTVRIRITLNSDVYGTTMSSIQEISLSPQYSHNLESIDSTKSRMTVSGLSYATHLFQVSVRAYNQLITQQIQIKRIPELTGAIGVAQRNGYELISYDTQNIANTTDVALNLEMNRLHSEIIWSQSYIRIRHVSTVWSSLDTLMQGKTGIISEQLSLQNYISQYGNGLYYILVQLTFEGTQIFSGTLDFFVDITAPSIVNAYLEKEAAKFSFVITEVFPVSLTYQLISDTFTKPKVPLNIYEQYSFACFEDYLYSVSLDWYETYEFSLLPNARIEIQATDSSGFMTSVFISLTEKQPISSRFDWGTSPLLYPISNQTIIKKCNFTIETLGDTDMKKLSIWVNGNLYIGKEPELPKKFSFSMIIPDGIYNITLEIIDTEMNRLLLYYEVFIEQTPQPNSPIVDYSISGNVFEIRWTRIIGASFYRVYLSSTNFTVLENMVPIYEGSDIKVLATTPTNRIFFTVVAVTDLQYKYLVSNFTTINYTPDVEKLTENYTVIMAPVAEYSTANGTFELKWTRVVGASFYRVYQTSELPTEIPNTVPIYDGPDRKIIIPIPTEMTFFVIVAGNETGQSFLISNMTVIQYDPIGEQNETYEDPFLNFNPSFTRGGVLVIIGSLIVRLGIKKIRKNRKVPDTVDPTPKQGFFEKIAAFMKSKIKFPLKINWETETLAETMKETFVLENPPYVVANEILKMMRKITNGMLDFSKVLRELYDLYDTIMQNPTLLREVTEKPHEYVAEFMRILTDAPDKFIKTEEAYS